MSKIIGNTTVTPYPRPDWNQTDENKADYIKNKPDLTQIVADNTIYTNTEPMLEDIGGVLAKNHEQGFKDVPIRDIIEELLYPYVPPKIHSFSLNPKAGVKEMNKPITVNTATATITKKSKEIIRVSLYKNNQLIQTKTDIDITSSSVGTMIKFDINETLDGSTDTTYYVAVLDADHTSLVSSSKLTYDFVYPYFYGVVDKDVIINPEVVLGLTEVIKAKESHSYSYTTSSQRPVIAYPAEYGELSSIVDHNNFIQKWTQNIVTVDNGSTINGVEYYVYVGGLSTATATYKFNY